MALHRENYLTKILRMAGVVQVRTKKEAVTWVPPVGAEPDRGRLAGFIPQRETEIGLRRSDKVGSK